MGNITGNYRSIDRAGLSALKQAAESDGHLEATEIDGVEQAFAQDGQVTTGEQSLVDSLRAATRDGQNIQNLQVADFDPTSQELSFDLSFGADNQGRATAESPANFINQLPNLPPGTRSGLLTSLQTGGLSDMQQKQVAQTLHRAGTPDQVLQMSQALQKATPQQVQAFARDLSALSPGEQQAVMEISAQLQQQPVPASLAQDIGTRMASLPDPPIPAINHGRHGFDVGQTLSRIGLHVPPTNPQAPGVEDASGRLSRVVMGGYRPGRDDPQNDYVRDMVSLGKQEGFKVTLQVDPARTSPAAIRAELVAQLPDIADEAELGRYLEIVGASSTGYEWAEDNKWIAADGTVVTTPDADDALNDMQDFVTYNTGAAPGAVGSQGHHTAGLTGNDPHDLVPENSSQGAVAGRNQHNQAEDLAQALHRGPARTTRTYNEGGNMLVGSFPNGDPYAVIGNDGVVASTFHLRREHAADPSKVPEFAPANLDTRKQQMGLDQPFNTLPATTQQLVDDTAQRLIGGPLTPANRSAARNDAITFLAQQDITRDIFAADVGVTRENLIFVDQPEFHIDMHMRPTAPGQITVNDFTANERLLQDALSRATPGSWEATEIQGMIDHNAQLQTVMAPVMNRITEQLQAGGLEVIRAPGVMEGPMANPDPSYPADQRVRAVNFMNAIPSTRPGTNEQFYITNYTSLAPIREAYEAYAETQGFEVHWVGNDNGSERFKSAAEESLHPRMGGLDCRENH